MRLIYSDCGLELNLEENKVCTVVIENPELFLKIIQDTLKQINGETGGWILSEGSDLLDIKKNFSFISNPVGINLNERKILNKIYTELKENIQLYFNEQYNKINLYIIDFMEDLFNSVSYSLICDYEIDINSFFKSINVCIDNNTCSPLEKLIDYLKVLKLTCGINVVGILNIKQYFNKNKLMQLYEYCFYNKIYLINFEGQKSYILEDEKCVIIDKDMCIIEF